MSLRCAIPSISAFIAKGESHESFGLRMALQAAMYTRERFVITAWRIVRTQRAMLVPVERLGKLSLQVFNASFSRLFTPRAMQ